MRKSLPRHAGRACVLYVAWLIFSIVALGGCQEVIRVPAICTNAPYCVPPEETGDRLKSRDPARLHAFLRRNAESTVLIQNTIYGSDGLKRKSSTGALVGSKGLVVTAYRTIAGSEFLTVSYRRMADDGTITNYRETPAELVTFSREMDVALLRIKNQDVLPAAFPLRHGPMAKGDDVWWFGITTAAGKMRVTGVGVARGVNTHGFVTLSGTLRAADAGAPMVNDCGELVGLLLYNDKYVFALPVDDLFKALDLKAQDLY